MKKVSKLVLATTLVAPMMLPVAQTVNAADEDVVKLRFLETTDLHTNVTNYDYFQDKVDNGIGLTKVATLIKSKRAETGATNTFLFDNGDTIQGTPFGDYVREEHTKNPQPFEHPMYAAMDVLDYDAVTLGNHEFNFGLKFLRDVMEGSKGKLRFVNSNVRDLNGKEIVADYNENGKGHQIIERTVVDADGEQHTVKVGVFGVVPPKIMSWDSGHLQGNVTAENIIPAARKAISELQAEGADVIVALAHSGIGDTAIQEEGDENVGYSLTQLEGLDVIMTGHQHARFPDAKSPFNGLPNVDPVNGLINGKPVVMANSQGKDLGVIDLEVELVNGEWTVRNPKAALSSINAATPVDAEVAAVVEDAHQKTISYIRQEVGQIQDDIHSYYALVRDDSSVQFVTNAQKWYVEKEMKTNLELAQYKNLPILSAGAPFKAGGRELSDASYYTSIPKGPIALKNVADLYVYPNTLEVVKVTGAEVMDWLEMSAGAFKQVTAPGQNVLDLSFRSYNFDVIDGLTYDIDVSEPAKFDYNGKVVNAAANRVKNIRYAGQEITPDQEFLVVTNNYRAGSSSFPGLNGGKNIVYRSAYETRNVISDYIVQSAGAVDYKADNNWSLISNAKQTVTFETADAGTKYVSQYEGIRDTAVTRADVAGRLFRTFELDLAPAEPKLVLSVNTVKPGSKTITGQTLPNAVVTLTEGGKVVATTHANAEGVYTFVTKPQMLRAELNVTATYGKQTVTETKVVGEGFVAPAAL